MKENAKKQIIGAFPLMDQGNRIGTVYSVFVSDGEESEVVDVTVPHGPGTPVLPVETENKVCASYAAFVRLFIEWREKSGEEQYDAAKDGVRKAARTYGRFAGNPAYLNKSGDTLHGAEFDEYTNESWASLEEKFSDVDGFADYLGKNLNPETGYPMSDDMLRRAAQNMIGRMQREQKKSSKMLSTDYTQEDDDGNEMATNIPDVSVDISGIVELDDFIDCVRDLLAKDPRDLDIFDGLLSGVPQTIIAEELGISPAAVSKRVKKIRDLIDKIK